MDRALTLLSFGWHLPYIRALACLGHRMDVIPTWSVDVDQPWLGARTLPPNARFVPRRQAFEGLRRHRYDLMVAHHRADLAALPSASVPIVLAVHHSPALDRLLGGDATLPAAGGALEVVFPSDRARSAWGRDGRVIPPGIDVDGTPTSTLDQPTALSVRHVGDSVASRLTRPEARELVDGLPVTALGLGVPGDGGHSTRPDAEIAAIMAGCRLLLHVPIDPAPVAPAWSVLEAMARALPVVALADRCDPVEHGTSGFVGTDPALLRRHVLALLDDVGFARRVGLAGRARVAESAGLPQFLDGWRTTIQDLLGA